MKKPIFLILLLLLFVGCASITSTKRTNEYDLVLKGTGLTIEECKVSCHTCKFTRKFYSTNVKYELWMVEDNGEGKSAYLHVVNGRIEKIKPQPLKKPKPKSEPRDKGKRGVF